MYFIIYVSSATTPFTNEELREMLTQSREKNARLDITGMLLYQEGNFMQVIEGPEEKVKELYKTISEDSRHSGIITLMQGVSEERQFPDWAMGFRDLASEEVSGIPGFSEFMNTPLTGAEFPSDPTRCQKLLLSFKELAR